MSKKRKAEKKLQNEQNILLALEEYVQKKQFAEFSDLSVLLRLEHKDWYMTFVKHYDYFQSLMISYQRKKGNPIPMQEENKKAENNILQIGKHSYDLNTVIGEADYRDFLFRVVSSYPFGIEFAFSRMKNLFFVVKNGREITAVCSVKKSAEECADSMSRQYTDNFYDVCWWNENNAFSHLHFHNS